MFQMDRSVLVLIMMNPQSQEEWDELVAASTQWDAMTTEERERWMPTVAHPWCTSHGREAQGRNHWESVCARRVVV